tara:strand:- start:639 stop:1439 length:801 start_codon:yes stop_codon:yes gene_type:complete
MRTKYNPLATIIIANYNNEVYLKKCLESVLNQQYKKIEVIVVDDFSSDNSLNILNEYKNFITIIKNKKKTKHGSYNQINAYQLGFKKSKGKIIFFLDSDDYFSKKKITTVINFFRNKNINIIFDLPIYDFKNKKMKKKFKQKLFIVSSWPRFSPQSCITLRRSYAKELFKVSKIKKFSTIWFDFRIAIYTFLKFKKITILKKYLTYYRQNPNSASTQFKTFSKNWWIRRSEAHDYFSYISEKFKIKDPLSIDKLITKFLKYIFYLK